MPGPVTNLPTDDELKAPPGSFRRFVVASILTLTVLALCAGGLIAWVELTRSPNYIRTDKVSPKPTVNIRGQLD